MGPRAGGEVVGLGQHPPRLASDADAKPRTLVRLPSPAHQDGAGQKLSASTPRVGAEVAVGRFAGARSHRVRYGLRATTNC